MTQNNGDVVEIFGKNISISKYRAWLRKLPRELVLLNHEFETRMIKMTDAEKHDFYNRVEAFIIEKVNMAIKYNQIANAEDLKIIKEITEGADKLISKISLKSGKSLIEEDREKPEGEDENDGTFHPFAFLGGKQVSEGEGKQAVSEE